jgi:hypothetical protein
MLGQFAEKLLADLRFLSLLAGNSTSAGSPLKRASVSCETSVLRCIILAMILLLSLLQLLLLLAPALCPSPPLASCDKNLLMWSCCSFCRCVGNVCLLMLPCINTVGIEVGLGLKPTIYIFDSHPHEIVDIATLEQKPIFEKP